MKDMLRRRYVWSAGACNNNLRTYLMGCVKDVLMDEWNDDVGMDCMDGVVINGSSIASSIWATRCSESSCGCCGCPHGPSTTRRFHSGCA